MQKHVNLVDLVKSFPTNIYLQNLASIQKRTSSVKFARLAEKSGKGSISNLSTKVCGESDTFSDFGACGEHVEEDVCTEIAGCLWDKRFAQCFETPVLTAAIGPSDMCGPRDGNVNCPCLNDNLQPELEGTLGFKKCMTILQWKLGNRSIPGNLRSNSRNLEFNLLQI